MKTGHVLLFRAWAAIPKSIAVFWLALLCSSHALVFASVQDVVRIEIESSWDGLGQPRHGRLIIKGERGRYKSSDRNIDPKAVEFLLAALEQPYVDQPMLGGCRVTDVWLLSNYVRGLEDYTHEKVKDLSPEQVQLFKGHFTDAASAQTAFGELFKNWHTDDYPKVSLAVEVGARNLSVQSTSQYPFMLPWIGTDQARGGYNCQISQAIAALVPKEFPNRSRLVVGESFRWDLTEQIMSSIEQRWNLLDTEYKIGPAVAPVFARFTPLKSAISNLSSVDLDGGQAWNAELQSKEWPSNFIVGISLHYDRRKLAGVDEFLSEVPKYSALVLAVPWLSDYLQRLPQARVELRYVDGRSLSRKAQLSMTEDLRTHGKAELANIVLQQGANSAFIEVNDGPGCWSRALVLPSKETLLWHFQCDSPLGLAAQGFETWDYYGWRSTGTIVKLDGTVAR